MDFEGSIKFSILEPSIDRVVGEMAIHPGIKNPYGVVHAGALLWLADVIATVLVIDLPMLPRDRRDFP